MKRLAASAFVFLAAACAPPAAEDAPEATAAAPSARRFIRPDGFPAGTPYTPGVLAGKTLYIAGQVDIDPATGEQPDGVEARTRQAMDNVGRVLAAAGLDYGSLASCHVQLIDMDHYQAMNGVYGSYFSDGRYPARTTLEMPALVGSASIEVTCVAYAEADAMSVVRPSPDVIPPAMGPYSPAVLAGDTLYLSGQGGRNPKTDETAEDVAEQTAQTLENISHTLEAAGLGFDNIVSANVYYLGPENRAAGDAAYGKAFQPGAAPSRGAFCLSRLPGTISVEITFIAAKDRYAVTRLFAPGDAPDAVTSPATLVGDTLYSSAYAAPTAGADVGAQFRAVMTEHLARLERARMGAAHVVNAGVYLKNPADFEAMNAVFREYFPENPPARTTVGVRQEGDRSDVLVEVALIAVK